VVVEAEEDVALPAAAAEDVSGAASAVAAVAAVASVEKASAASVVAVAAAAAAAAAAAEATAAAEVEKLNQQRKAADAARLQREAAVDVKAFIEASAAAMRKEQVCMYRYTYMYGRIRMGIYI